MLIFFPLFHIQIMIMYSVAVMALAACLPRERALRYDKFVSKQGESLCAAGRANRSAVKTIVSGRIHNVYNNTISKT
jgi:hypothetical protein